MSTAPGIPDHATGTARSDRAGAHRRHRMSTRSRILFFVTAWLIVLMPFLFWWNTWFGRHLSDKQLHEYLHDAQKPRHIQHALVQIGGSMAQNDAAVKKYYPDLVRLARHPAEEIRSTDAWAMGQDSTVNAFHQALLNLLQDPSPTVRGNAALALVRFGDAAGKAQITQLLQPVPVLATDSGKVVDTAKPGTAVRRNGLLIKLQANGKTVEVRSPITGRVRSMQARDGDLITAGRQVAIIDPGSDQVWEALRALYVIGGREDLTAVRSYESPLPDMPDRIRQQAQATDEAIRNRAR